MRSLPFVASLLALPIATACVYIDAEDHDRHRFHVETQFGLPSLLGADVQAETVSIRIDSGGCTNKDTIEASTDKDGRNEYEVAFDRLKDDNCEAYLPEGVRLTWTYDELGIPAGAYVRILNPVEG